MFWKLLTSILTILLTLSYLQNFNEIMKETKGMVLITSNNQKIGVNVVALVIRF